MASGNGPINILKLFEETRTKARQIAQNIEDEAERAEIQKKLNAIHAEYKELNALLKTVNRNQLPLTQNRKAHKTLRKRPNPMFRNLGIPVPVGQRPGNELAPAGTKIKKDRRMRRRTRRAH